MNLTIYNYLMNQPPDQNPAEWREYLLFIERYFYMHEEVKKPVVVEIGVRKNRQKKFYNQLLEFDHIGIDISPKRYADITGNSHDHEVRRALKRRLKKRKINILFIDGDHSFSGCLQDYEEYSLLTEHLIVFHDIFCIREDVQVSKVWEEVRKDYNDEKILEFYHPEHDIDSSGMGIGIIKLKD